VCVCVQVKLAKPQPTTNANNNNNNQIAMHLQSVEPDYITADDDASQVLCRWQFDVTGYQPAEVNVKIDAGKLLVSARHADVKDVDNTSSRQLNKQTDIPRDVIHEEMTSYMTRDGVLVVQAPVLTSRDTAAMRRVTSSGSEVKMAAVNGDDTQDLDCRFRPIELPPEQPPSDDAISASRRHIVKTGPATTVVLHCSQYWTGVLY